MKVNRHRTLSSLAALVAAGLTIAQIPLCHGQDTGPTSAQAQSSGPASSASVADPAAVPAEVTKELELMKARIDTLEKQLKARDATPGVSAAQPTSTDAVPAAAQQPSLASKGTPAAAAEPSGPTQPF